MVKVVKTTTQKGAIKMWSPVCDVFKKEQTNEEWFASLSTEEKAEWLADHMKCSKCPQQNRCNGYHGGCVALMLEWLKQPHKQKGD